VLSLLCEKCNKNNATIHFTKIINGQVEERHLCETCAKENNELEFNFEVPFSFEKLFTGLIDSIQEDPGKRKDITCPKCGLTYKKFQEVGKFGCAKCYEVFRKDISSLVKGIHGHNTHQGKVPIKTKDKVIQKKAIESLKMELEKSIEKEDFERAAYLRDEINRLREKLGEI